MTAFMEGSGKEIIRRLFEFFGHREKILFVLLLICGILLFDPLSTVTILGLTDFVQENKSSIAIVFIVSIAIFLADFFWKIYTCVKIQLSRSAIKRKLEHISSLEKLLLKKIVLGGEQTIFLAFTDPVALSLEGKGLLMKAGGLGQERFWPMTVPTWLFKFLSRNPEILFGDIDPFDNENVQKVQKEWNEYLNPYR